MKAIAAASPVAAIRPSRQHAHADGVRACRPRRRRPRRRPRRCPPRRRRPAFFNAALAGPCTAVCPPRRRSPQRAARTRALTRSASPGDPALRPRGGDPRAGARPERPRIRPCRRVTARSWPEGGFAFGRG